MEFFMDVSPSWWLKAREDEIFLKKYVFEKFECDYYPRTITQGRKEIDLGQSGQLIKERILENLKFGNFKYEFLPEDENIKESYLISNGNIHFHPRRKRTNSRLLIKVNI
jgi:hypothetical protein